MKIIISSGHGKYVRGASGVLDEVDEARKVVNAVAQLLKDNGVSAVAFHDDTSHSQQENLETIVDFHNGEPRDLDVSVHFNAYEDTGAPMGTECLYVTQYDLAKKVSDNIWNDSGLKNRGPKKRTDLYFLNKTDEPAILIEVCFVDSTADAFIYNTSFDAICIAIAEALSGLSIISPPPHPPIFIDNPPETSGSQPLFYAKGKASYFGGPDDEGVSPSEGLAFFTTVSQKPELFLALQPQGTTGLARRLNPYVHYVACRWDYDVTPKAILMNEVATVTATKTGITLKAFPADWGPHSSTGRIADLSPCLMEDLGIKTDDEVEVSLG